MGRLPFRVLNTPNRVTAAVSVATFGIGLGVGYLLGRRGQPEVSTVTPDVEPDLPSVNFEAARKSAKRKRGTIIVPAMDRTKTELEDHLVFPEVAPDVKEPMTIDWRPVPEDEDEDEEELITQSVFNSDIPWDAEAEMENRTSGNPYVLHKNEFYANLKDYTQTTLTYYAGDNIMTDEDDKPVYNYTDITGPLNFGHGSGSPDIVYVRNDQRRAEYEILKDDGLYSSEVLGMHIENNQRSKSIQHSKVPKFRPDS